MSVPPPAEIARDRVDAKPLSHTSYTTLLAAARYFETSCSQATDAFLECKERASAPHRCLTEAQNLVAAFDASMQKLEQSKCRDSFLAFRSCLDDKSHNYFQCDSERLAYYDCVDGKKPSSN